jgi:heme exporter protein A
MSSADPLISATALVRRFGSVTALGGVDLDVAGGELVLLLGANGAGKTTLLRILAGLTLPLRGTVHVAAHDLHAEPDARRAVGFLSHSALVYEDLTPRENLAFTAALHQLHDSTAIIARALEVAGLGARADRPTRGFSRGMLQRLALARATLHDPPILLLDEPFTGLDAQATAALVTHLLAERDRGRAIVAVTHDPEVLWSAATRVVLLEAGVVALDIPRPEDPGPLRGRIAGLRAA